MTVSRLQNYLGSGRRRWLSVIAGVALGASIFGATTSSVTLAQSDADSVDGLIQQIFAEVFGGGATGTDVSDSGGHMNVGGNMGGSVTMGGSSGGGITVGGSGGSGGGGMSSGTYNGG